MPGKLMLTISAFIMQLTLATSQQMVWPMTNGSPQRTSQVEMDLDFPLEVADVFDVPFVSEGGMIVTDQYIFVMGSRDTSLLIAANVTTGEILWEYPIPGSPSNPSFVPAYGNGVVIAGGQNSVGYDAIDVASGDVLWSKAVGSTFARGPLVVDDGVILTSGREVGYYDLTTGNERWSVNKGTPRAPAVVEDGVVYFCVNRDGVEARNLATGDSIWFVEAPSDLFGAMSVDDSLLFVTAPPNRLYALDTRDGSMVWDFPMDTTLNWNVGTPGPMAQAGDYLVLRMLVEGDEASTFLVIDKTTGEEVNRFPAEAREFACPTIIDGNLVDVFRNGLKFLSIPEGDSLYSITVSSSHFRRASQVLVANDKLYIGGRISTVHVLSESPSSTASFVESLEVSLLPNPVDDRLTVQYALDRQAEVTIDVLSIDGAQIERKRLGVQSPGDHQVEISVVQHIPAVYLARLQVGDEAVVRKFVKH